MTLLAELADRGVELRAEGERLRFRPIAAMTSELVAGIKACKPELLAVLAGGPISAGEGDAHVGDERPQVGIGGGYEDPPESLDLSRNPPRGKPSPSGEGLQETHADREIDRFLRVAVPRPDGRGRYDPGRLRDEDGQVYLACTMADRGSETSPVDGCQCVR